MDETTNPIHIITCGSDFHVRPRESCPISATPNFSVYVRVLPTTDDLVSNKVHFELNSKAKSELRSAIRSKVQNYHKSEAALRESDRAMFYANLRDLRKKTADNVFARYGASITDLESIDEALRIDEKELIDVEEFIEGESHTPTDETDEYDLHENEFSFISYPGCTNTLPESLVKEVRPVQKWIRIDLGELPPIEFDAADDIEKISLAVENASANLNTAVREKILAWTRDPDEERGGKIWAYPQGLKVNPSQVQNWDRTLETIRKTNHLGKDDGWAAIPNIDLKWQVELHTSTEDNSVKFVHLALENAADHPPISREEVEESVFQVNVAIAIPTVNHQPLRLDRVKSSYRYNQYLDYAALGFNAGIESSESEGKVLLKTTWMPIYRQPRIRPRVYANIDVSFRSLSNPKRIHDLEAITRAFSEWLEETKQNTSPSKGARENDEIVREEEAFKADLGTWIKEKDKIQEGINLLAKSAQTLLETPESEAAIPAKAWCYMNEAMAELDEKKHYKSWRLFQIAFILANISGFVSRMKGFEDAYDPEWDESVALLYFSTGGGKTEAFFGLLVFVLFLDRLRGKENGVSAMLRYPLRLLTVQQAQRLASTLAFAEKVRWKYEVSGRPFEIGFWVGRANTPNRRSEITPKQIPSVSRNGKTPDESDLLKTTDYLFAMENWNKLPTCPFCEAPTGLRKFPGVGDRIGHVCTSKDCDWNIRHGGLMSYPLPFHIVDDDIYDFAPSVILGTIDKLALIGNTDTTIRRVFGMFGLAQHYDPETGQLIVQKSPLELRNYTPPANVHALSPVYERGISHWVDPFPAMIIQDEAHLLEESLGTFSGIFQTLFEQVLEQLSQLDRVGEIVATDKEGKMRLPKIVAATATVSEPQRQMEALYQRRVSQFPHPGPTLYESFYSAPVEPDSNDAERTAIKDIEVRSQRARLYSSLLTNGRPHTSTSVEILAHFHLCISQILVGLNSPEESLNKATIADLVSGVLSSELRSFYQDTISNADLDEIATLIDLHRIALTYVTNKKGGDQIMAAESDAASRLHNRAGLDFDGFETKLISGSVEASEIESVIRQSEDRPEHGSQLQDIRDGSLIRSVVATSAISHGVDVNELNSMFFAGMPSDTAEYIQASSRIGRTHVGFSLLIPTPQRRRDRYILEVNDIYHRFLERMIKPAAVDRWAESALVRALPSILLTYLIAVVEQQRLHDEPDSKKFGAHDMSKLQEINRLREEKGPIRFTDDLNDFVKGSVGLTHTKFSPSAVDQIGHILDEAMKDGLLQTIFQSVDDFESLSSLFDHLETYQNHKKKPMTSLRDVDPAGLIKFVSGASRIGSETAYEIIRTIRRGAR
ncbi:MAG: helicase-related protein [Pseudomonadota bacterium]